MGRRLLTIMGSGETTPTMVTPHQRILQTVADLPGDAVLLDTPYGFQENAGEITTKAGEYFRRNVGHEVRPLSLRDVDDASPAEIEAAAGAIEEAAWVFAGPGSPTYLLRHWHRTRIPAVLRDRLHGGDGATVFASAAAVTLGRHALPVYEIYKVGERPRWIDGLDLLDDLGLDCVVIPHFDNAEGGTHDTRYCYLGERRLRLLERDLAPSTFVLGVDEHTALTLDLETGRTRIEGRGCVTVRHDGGDTTFAAGSDPTIDDLLAAARDGASGPSPDATAGSGAPATGEPSDGDGPAPGRGAAAVTSPLLEEVASHRERFDRALTDGDAIGASDAVLGLEASIRAWSADTLQGDEVDRAVEALRTMIVRLGRAAARGLHDHRDLLAPTVDLLLDLRDDARDDGAYATADRIRDTLTTAGVEVRDTPNGPHWTYTDD